ncbi:integrase catalytic domain-containing protein [Nephila pilipes]|uniref:Integrase catalytic domain-containing protein n=1 Tax=Nephila pilipes TaxID=299642 RepID=A0A8X6M9A8_NEPPI|nr:integrase catalytic domain-containing protein [Nephila pilipes]
MIHLCSSKLAEKLQLQKENVNLSVGCLSGLSTTVKSKVSVVIFNEEKTSNRKLEFFVVPKIPNLMPSLQINLSNAAIPKNIKLANPEFYELGKIDLFLDSEIFFDLMRSGQIYVPNSNLVLQNSTFGHLIGRSIENFRDKKRPVHCRFINKKVETQMKKFFDLESIGIRDDPHCYDENKALEIFNKTVSFKNNRYTASIPWEKNCNQLGDNHYVAEKRLKGLERRMKFDNSLYLKYRGILNEYLDRDIIEKLSDTSKPLNKPVCYLPHQAVYREESITTKMHIVFDERSHKVGQLSINDCLWPGINLN